MISAVIVAAGSSQRMGFDKLSADLGGKSVLEHSINAFERCSEVGEIIVVSSNDRFDWIESFESEKMIAVIEGGAQRHFSVLNGIKRADPSLDLIAVHDGARPLISPVSISTCAAKAAEFGAASLANRVVDTLKRSEPGSTYASESVCRENLWAMQTPQIFRTEIIHQAYGEVVKKGDVVTDEVSAVQAIGIPVHLVENPEPNFKITVPSDLALAKALQV